MSGWVWAVVIAAALLALALLRRPLGAVWRLLARSGLALAFLWLFRGVGALLGIQLGVNLFNSVVLGLLGAPGFALLLLTQWVIR